jgi:hypothetical protein
LYVLLKKSLEKKNLDGSIQEKTSQKIYAKKLYDSEMQLCSDRPYELERNLEFVAFELQKGKQYSKIETLLDAHPEHCNAILKPNWRPI